MRSQTGLLCNWQKPLQGILDTMVLAVLVLLVSFIIPILGWGSFACPLAYFIDKAFGKILRAKRYHCPNITVGDECDFPINSMAFERMLLFVVPLVFSVAFFVYSNQSKYRRGIGVARLMAVMSGSLVLYTFLPWFINDYLNNTPAYVEGGAVLISALLWFFVPLLRNYSSLVIIVYVFAYVVYWRVYEGEIFGVEYSHKRFVNILFVSGLVLLFSSIFGKCHLHLVHVYNRWRLQKAFYSKKSRGKGGCAGIGCYDIFPGLNCRASQSKTDAPDYLGDNEGALNLAHLEGIKPQYISNIVVNGWRLNKEDETEYGLLTMSPEIIERLDNGGSIIEQPGPSMFSGKLNPGDVKLSQAMATSAAAVSTHMGSYEEAGEDYKNILTILGMEMGASVVSDVAYIRRQSLCVKILPCLIRVMFVVPLLVLPVLHYVGYEDSIFLPIGIGSYFAFIFVLSFPAMWNTGNKDPGCTDTVARWLIVHVPFSSFMRSIFDVVNTGPMPPAILHLSDGGHIENLALLPLLKRRLQRIVVVNGGHTVPDNSYGNSLVRALELARDNLNCSFIGVDGRDVLEDIKYKFVNGKASENQPRSYRFRVDYYDQDKKTKIGEGEVVLIAPRHPAKGSKMGKLSWSACDLDGLEAGHWGSGPGLNKDVDGLTGCCCECCHNKTPCCCSDRCGVFPQHITANQFFTPTMFAAYHREGYRACLEAEADVFLSATKDEHVTHETSV